MTKYTVINSWIPVRYKLPEDFETVWVWHKGDFRKAWYRSDIDSWAVEGCGTNQDVKVWCPAILAPYIEDDY